jgi:hypothetical protein
MYFSVERYQRPRPLFICSLAYTANKAEAFGKLSLWTCNERKSWFSIRIDFSTETVVQDSFFCWPNGRKKHSLKGKSNALYCCIYTATTKRSLLIGKVFILCVGNKKREVDSVTLTHTHAHKKWKKMENSKTLIEMKTIEKTKEQRAQIQKHLP